MNKKAFLINLPRILVIDDFLGQSLPGGHRNVDRASFCGQVQAVDVTGDQESPNVARPVAELVFYSGQNMSGNSMANDLEGTLEFVREGWTQWPRWALVLLDLHFATGPIGPDGRPVGQTVDEIPSRYFGLTLLEHLRLELPDLPIVILSSRDRKSVSLDLDKLGSGGFLPREQADRQNIEEYLFNHGLIEDERGLIIGRSVPLLQALKRARNYATGNGNILIQGETGTGKELLARYIHDMSPVREGSYEVLDTHSVPEDLIEDELFGHQRGAYSGANQDRPGKFELADEGTLFIDEFADIPKNIQPKLLRVLETEVREVHRLGSTESQKLQLQVVLATNRDLEAAVREGSMREDLEYRIPDHVRLPPLRARREDISLLVESFVKILCRRYSAREREVTPEAMEMLVSAPWPDNVRGLKNTVERAIKENRDADYLTPVHLDIKEERTVMHTSPIPTATSIPENVESIQDIDLVIKMLEKFTFSNDYADLQGRLVDIRRAYARLIANCLRSALTCPAIRKVSPENPEGEINVTGAIKCLTGQTRIRTSKAYDTLFQLLEIDPDVQEEIQDDPVLSEAYMQAFATRRPGAKKEKR